MYSHFLLSLLCRVSPDPPDAMRCDVLSDFTPQPQHLKQSSHLRVRNSTRSGIHIMLQNCTARLFPPSPSTGSMWPLRALHLKQLLPVIIILPGSMAGESASQSAGKRRRRAAIHWQSSERVNECIPHTFSAPCTSSCFRFFSSFVLFMLDTRKEKHTSMETGAAAARFNSRRLLSRKTSVNEREWENAAVYWLTTFNNSFLNR